MLNEFLNFIGENRLFTKTDRLLLAVSGGLDSMVLAHLCRQGGYTFAITHCNFNLRGEDSLADEQLVKNLADTIGVPCYIKRFETKKYAIQEKVSTQLAARTLRYDWFDTLLVEHRYTHLVTAHHVNDSLETALYNFTKGTGLNGLKGILPEKGHIVRPLLFATRSEIEDYARAEGIVWREDHSNRSNDYSRNLIRNEVIPHLRHINPGLEHTFLNTQLRMRSTLRVLKAAVDEFEQQYVTYAGIDVRIDKKGMQEAELAIADEILKPYGFNITQVKDVVQSLGETGKIFNSASHRLNTDRLQLIISPIELEVRTGYIEEEDDTYVNALFSLHIAREPMSDTIDLTDGVIRLDLDQVEFPLRVRKWREGDAFIPLGMSGKKKLSDFMIDNKIPLNLKERVCVVESGGEIAWVIGHRLDDRFKVRPETAYTLNFRIIYHD